MSILPIYRLVIRRFPVALDPMDLAQPAKTADPPHGRQDVDHPLCYPTLILTPCHPRTLCRKVYPRPQPARQTSDPLLEDPYAVEPQWISLPVKPAPIVDLTTFYSGGSRYYCQG